MKIIAFSGKKQSGKTTAVLGLEKKLINTIPHAINFADGLKKIVAMCFGATSIEMETDEGKNTLLPCGKTVREVLQIVGTDWFRHLDPLCWVRAYKKAVDDNMPIKVGQWKSTGQRDALVITSDVRFPNEVECVQDLGGHVIRFLRAPFKEEDQHESETALDDVEAATISDPFGDKYVDGVAYGTSMRFNTIVDNRDMTIEQQNEVVWKLVTGKGWI